MKQWIIAISVAVMYLIVSFTFHLWTWSWVIWVLYAGYRLLENKMNQGGVV